MLCEQCESTNTTDVDGHVKCQEHHIESYDYLQRVRYHHEQERLSDLYDLSEMEENSQYLEMKYHLD